MLKIITYDTYIYPDKKNFSIFLTNWVGFEEYSRFSFVQITHNTDLVITIKHD